MIVFLSVRLIAKLGHVAHVQSGIVSTIFGSFNLGFRPPCFVNVILDLGGGCLGCSIV